MDRPKRMVLSVAEAAEVLGISRSLAYDLVARGELPARRFGGRIVVLLRPLQRLLDGEPADDASGPPADLDGLSEAQGPSARSVVTTGICSHRTVPVAAAITAATITATGEHARGTRAAPSIPAPNPLTETIKPTLPKNTAESTTPPDPELTTPPETNVSKTNSTFPNPTTERPTDICHPFGRALPGRAPSGSEPGC